MIESMNNLREGKIENIPDNMLRTLTIWSSGYWKNTNLCNFINKHFFFVKPKILISLLSLGIDKNQRFIRYPKSAKDKDDKLEIIKPYLKKIYKWGEREFNFQKNIVIGLMTDKKFLNDLNKKVGFDKSECKKLGIEFKVFNVEKPKDIDSKSLFSRW